MVDTIIKKLIEGNNKYRWKIMQEQESVELKGKIPKYPVLILTCMDSRIDIHRIFQLSPGDVFVLRNGGNQYSEDMLRSLLIAIYEYGVQYIIILGHLDCGMKKINLNELKDNLPIELLRGLGKTSVDLRFALQRFFKTISDEILNIKNQVDRFHAIQSIPKNVKIIGMIYDPASGWVFNAEDFQQYSSYEKFMRNYRELLEKKQLDQIDFLETIEPEIVGLEHTEPVNLKQIRINEKTVESVDHVEALNEGDDGIYIGESETQERKLDQLNLPDLEKYMKMPSKIQMPKIYVPKIKVYVPSINKLKLYNNKFSKICLKYPSNSFISCSEKL
jgi:carbonic anhydrase